MKYPRGSEWRKWDLHVHTPASDKYFGTFDQVIQQINKSTADVIGVNDYFTIAGYRELISKKDEINGKVLLPVVEMRMHNILANRQSDTSGVRINFHIIFNPFDVTENKDLLPDIESFIKSIKYKKISGQDAHISTIYDNKAALLDEVTVDYNTVLDELEKLESLAGNYLVWLPYDEYGGVDGVQSTNFPFKPALINRAHILGSSNKSQIEYFMGKGSDYSEYFDRPKPCIKGSDAHSHEYPIGKLKDAASNSVEKYCWIKADPSFDGLKQIVREPEHRVFIGEEPKKLAIVAKNKTKYIHSISIKKIKESKHRDIWFDNNIELNTDLVAIIGNKGMGKSALAEILGLTGNSYNYEHFSFLGKDKFKKNKLAANFEASLKWHDKDDELIMNLDDSSDLLKRERVKCIPQNYLETLCNTLGDKFQNEIDNVVFSHIDTADQIGKKSLSDLIAYKTQIIDGKIKKIQDDIVNLNREIIIDEEKLLPDYLRLLGERLKAITNDLHSHCAAKPSRVSQPDGDESIQIQRKGLHEKITSLNNDIQTCENNIKNKRERLLRVNEDIEKLNIVKGKIEAFEGALKDLSKGVEGDLKDILGINISDIVRVEVNYDKLIFKISVLTNEKNSLNIQLDSKYNLKTSLPEDYLSKNLYKMLYDKQEEANKLKEQMDEPFKKYQKYLKDLSEWKESFRQKNSERKNVKKDITAVKDTIPAALIGKYDKRKTFMSELFSLLKDKVKVYEDLYKPVIEFISAERNKNKYMELNFSADIMISPDFDEKFASYIDRGKKGSFQGVKESENLLRETRQKYNFSTLDGAIGFVDDIIEKLKRDEYEERLIEDQLVKDKTRSSLYAYLYLLKFLKIDYRLRWGDKSLEDLSPGERGTVLLIFYLLIDKNDVPLIIDQPEENLDNESIYHLLVRYIKEAKSCRQIIIVTHNPNLAVVCDAEQIVHCYLDKRNKYKVVYTTGSIENQNIRQKIINILEGTKPAFTNRQDKYELN